MRFGAGNDLSIFHDGTDSFLNNTTGSLRVQHSGTNVLDVTAAKVAVTGRAVSASITEEDDGSFDLATSNNFVCVTAGSTQITFSNVVAGQSGNIKFVQSGGHTVTAAAIVGINATALAALQTAGTYNLSYYVAGGNTDGTTSGTSDVLVSVSGALTSQGA